MLQTACRGGGVAAENGFDEQESYLAFLFYEFIYFCSVEGKIFPQMNRNKRRTTSGRLWRRDSAFEHQQSVA